MWKLSDKSHSCLIKASTLTMYMVLSDKGQYWNNVCDNCLIKASIGTMRVVSV